MVLHHDDKKERRYERYKFNTEVHYQSPYLSITEETRNISAGGVFIASSLLDEIGTRAKLHIYVPGSARPVEVEGVVRWTTLDGRSFVNDENSENGMGVEFVERAVDLDKELAKIFSRDCGPTGIT
ncbi:MAG: hypothetical protein GXP49_11995 [Deltaproteobacteria bacterium]|nr:hypothetical protein [Deltaproteobacteria bacterium]